MKRRKVSKKEETAPNELSCHVCGGHGKIEIIDYNKAEDGLATGLYEACEWCGETGIEPDIDAIEIRPDQVGVDDIKAIETACCSRHGHWSVIQPEIIIAASVNHMMSVLPGRAMEGRMP
jgi:hypothetical protein